MIYRKNKILLLKQNKLKKAEDADQMAFIMNQRFIISNNHSTYF